MTLELIHNEETDTFSSGMDVRISDDRDLSLLEDEAELLQAVRKALLTRKQFDGYGTYLSKLRGTKNTYLLRALSIMTVVESLQVLRFSQLEAYAKGRISKAALLKTVESVKTLAKQQIFKLSVLVRSAKDVEEAADVVI